MAISRCMEIRPERPGDERAITTLIEQAFAEAGHRDGTESEIVSRLRNAGVLTLSLVAVEDGMIVGHAGFSPVTVDDCDLHWFGLGPVAVRPDRQGTGIGASLIENGLVHLRAAGAKGCVVLGEPDYYGRFGFQADERLSYPGPPARFFQVLALNGEVPSGVVAYHPAFG